MASEPVNLEMDEEASKGLTGLARAADPRPNVLAAVAQDPVVRAKKKFVRLRDEWKSQRGHESSTMKLVLFPAYQKIIGMGPAAIPFLLRELETDIDMWFWALMAITEEDPVPTEARGDGQAMARAWLDWAKDRGLQW
jgi:hypothetical protein